MRFIIRLVLIFLFLFTVILIGGSMVLAMTVEFFIPSASGSANTTADIIILFGMLILFISSLLFFAWFIGRPIYYIVLWIFQLAQGCYEEPFKRNMYSRESGTLKQPYKLYEEMIVQLRTLTETLARNERERIAMDKMKEEWISGISHDLKTPLTYITGYSEMMLLPKYQWSEEDKTEFLKQINQKGLHMQALIQDLNLSLQLNGQRLPLHVEPVNMVELIRRIVADVVNAPWASEYLLSFHADIDLLEMTVDPQFLQRALRNLIVNAIIHNPSGTNVTVSLRQSPTQIIIMIEDNGIGMDKETVDRLFDRYYRGTTTDANSEGTGLGMAIALQLIAAHHGEIDVASRKGEGTSVRVMIPLS
ncbi:sensor histidine kinase [Paenibacillus elgii]|uniref:sensor histidine kinase n=1 Tax=Paenibacillus elgii TaxID=189691 RepID=UPI0030DD3537